MLLIAYKAKQPQQMPIFLLCKDNLSGVVNHLCDSVKSVGPRISHADLADDADFSLNKCVSPNFFCNFSPKSLAGLKIMS